MEVWFGREVRGDPLPHRLWGLLRRCHRFRRFHGNRFHGDRLGRFRGGFWLRLRLCRHRLDRLRLCRHRLDR
ncbi:MAG TPA: hypothetical protein VHM89_12755, partial [Acidimicrobiales bacterium]|nr:hypothetical protein [Acidimicrobiales bacterium]